MSGQIPHIPIGSPSLHGGVILKWFYLSQPVGTPLSEVLSALLVKLNLLRLYGEKMIFKVFIHMVSDGMTRYPTQ